MAGALGFMRQPRQGRGVALGGMRDREPIGPDTRGLVGSRVDAGARWRGGVGRGVARGGRES